MHIIYSSCMQITFFPVRYAWLISPCRIYSVIFSYIISICHAKQNSVIPCTLNIETNMQNKEQCLQLHQTLAFLSAMHSAEFHARLNPKPRVMHRHFITPIVNLKKKYIYLLSITGNIAALSVLLAGHFQAESTPSCTANKHAVTSCTNLRHKRGLIFSLHIYRDPLRRPSCAGVMQTSCTE